MDKTTNTTPENFRVINNLEAMRSEGITDNSYTRRLAGLDHVTPEYIKAHCKQVRGERQQLGLALKRIEQNIPVPLPRKYDDSPYSDFINR